MDLVVDNEKSERRRLLGSVENVHILPGDAHKAATDNESGEAISSWFRYLMLGLLCLVRITTAYSNDMPAALESTIIRVARVDITQYELLYSLYAWPSVFLAVIGGVLIDRVFGIRLGLLLFITIACTGQLLVAMGGFFNQFWLMVVGRFVLGGGAELSGSAVDIFTATLFRDRELSFVFGILFGASGLTTSLSLNLNSRLYDLLQVSTNHHIRLGSVFLFGFTICGIGLMIGSIVSCLDYSRRKKFREKEAKFKLKDIIDFSVSYWLLALTGLLFYVAVYPFINIAQNFFIQKYDFSTPMANLVNTCIDVVPIVAGPVLGLVSDWTGYKLCWGVFTATGTVLCHIVLAFTGQYYFIPIISTISLGLFFAIYTSVIWPQVFVLVRKDQLGTAYGIQYAFYELGQAVADIVIGLVIDTSGYMIVEISFASIGALSLLMLIGLFNTSGGQKLNNAGILACTRLIKNKWTGRINN